jgi:hypothetical protein
MAECPGLAGSIEVRDSKRQCGTCDVLADTEMSPAVQSDFMRTLKISQCACGLAVTILALGFCSYSIRELLASLALFTMAFLFLALAVLAAILLWWASEELANRTGPASRKVIAFSRRLIATYARP